MLPYTRRLSAVMLTTATFLLGPAALVAADIGKSPGAMAQTAAVTPREVPTRPIPVPTTVSPEMQRLVAAPLTPGWNVIPKSGEEWKAAANKSAAATVQRLPGFRD